jgi:hypothetical protein
LPCSSPLNAGGAERTCRRVDATGLVPNASPHDARKSGRRSPTSLMSAPLIRLENKEALDPPELRQEAQEDLETLAQLLRSEGLAYRLLASTSRSTRACKKAPSRLRLMW